MAEFSKYPAHSIGRLFLHNNRYGDDGVTHSNESIDPTRTYNNYNLKKGTVTDVQNRLSTLFKVKTTNESTIIGEMIVTLPKDVRSEDERDFFQAVFDFYCGDFREENIMNAVIHKDEKTPHIHIDFVPVLQGVPTFNGNRAKKALEDWKQSHNGEMPTERLCCKSLITREYLRMMHPRLSAFVKESIGYEVGILNGATANGNKTVQQLKLETLKKEVAELENQKERLADDVKNVLSLVQQFKLSENDFGLYPLIQKVADLENQNKVLKEIIARQGYTWKSEDLKAIQAKKYVPSVSATVNVYSGSLVNAEIEDNAVVVIELPNKVQRALPQQGLIDRDFDLARQIRMLQMLPEDSPPVIVRPARTSKRTYVFVKTDNTNQTVTNLFLLERRLRELDLTNRKVYMDRMDTDIYDFAKSILEKEQIKSVYFTNEQNSESKTKESYEHVIQENE